MRIPLLLVMFLIPLLMLGADQKALLNVSGNCASCKKRIVQAVKAVDGVKEANWDKRTKVLTVEFADTLTSVETITNAILKVGHDVEDKKASDEAYNAVPDCCKYRDKEE